VSRYAVSFRPGETLAKDSKFKLKLFRRAREVTLGTTGDVVQVGGGGESVFGEVRFLPYGFDLSPYNFSAADVPDEFFTEQLIETTITIVDEEDIFLYVRYKSHFFAGGGKYRARACDVTTDKAYSISHRGQVGNINGDDRTYSIEISVRSQTDSVINVTASDTFYDAATGDFETESFAEAVITLMPA
jgi:hypothetical protein